MILFDDTSVVYGYPLQYYDPFTITIPGAVNIRHLDQELCYYTGSVMDTVDEFLVPNSPNSTQSDSDSSTSDPIIEKQHQSQNQTEPEQKQEEIKCGWNNCSQQFHTLEQLAAHVSETHAHSSSSGLFYCGWQGCTRNAKGFNARYKMLVHVRTHTNEKPHRCYQCDKSFSRAENLKIHSRSHSGEKPYVCPVPGCGKAYSNSSDRFKHTRTHQVQKPYMCKVPGCAKRYTDPSSLRKHVKTYKHFVKTEHIQKPEQTVPVVKENQTKNESTHKCCLQTCLTNAAQLLKLGAFMSNCQDLRSYHCNNTTNGRQHQLETDAWNKFLTPSRLEEMDVDLPLDLTVNRK